MAQKKSAPKPRSPMTTKVFEAFIGALRADEEFDDAVCDRLKSVLDAGKAVKPADLEAALFPPDDSKDGA